MKKHLGKLPKPEREKIEAEFLARNPRDFDDRMSRAKRYSPRAIRLSPKMIEHLKMLAKSEGEPEYETMVKRWIEERLEKETSIR